MPRTDLDSIYRLLFGHPRVIEDLLRGFASSAVGDLLDMTSLKQVAARHVSEGLRQSENDMIWEVRTRQGGRLYVYIMLEFQAKTNPTGRCRYAWSTMSGSSTGVCWRGRKSARCHACHRCCPS